MTMNRRQFLKLAAAAPVVAKVAPLLPPPAPRLCLGTLTVGPPTLRIPNIDASLLRPNVFFVNYKTYLMLQEMAGRLPE